MGSHRFGFQKSHEDNVIFTLMIEDLCFAWATGEKITESTFGEVRMCLYDFTISKNVINARDVQYMQQYLSRKGCPKE